MALPSASVLQASLRWLDLLRRGSRAAAWATVRDGVNDGLTATQYGLAYDWMLRIGLVDREGVVLATRPLAALGDSQMILGAALLHESPPWLPEVQDLVPTADDLPIDWSDAAEALGVTTSDCFALACALGGKIDLDARAALGAQGEELVVEFLESHPGVIAHRVSLVSDALGFDVLARRGAVEAHIEVKAVRPRQHVRLYLSRNEFETMKRDSLWCLVLAIVSADGRLLDLRVGPHAALAVSAPSDRPGDGRWEVMRLRVRPSTWEAGLSLLEIPPPGATVGSAAISGGWGSDARA